MLLDVFHGDAFHWTKLVASVNRLPFAPTKLGDMGLFSTQGVNTLTVAIELRDGTLTLVPAGQRGQRGAAKNPAKRRVIDIRTTHLPQSVTLYADEVQGLRAYGSESETETAMSFLMQKMAVAKQDLDVTHEYHRVGALKGVVLDADGTSTLYDFFSLFGLTKQTQDIAFGTSTTDVRGKIVAAKRLSEDKLGGLAVRSFRGIAGKNWLDALQNHATVIDSYRMQQGNVNRADNRDGFTYGDVVWEEYRGSVGGNAFVDPDKAYLVPEGVPGLFTSYYSPADYMETVNTMGVPFYTKGEDMKFGKGIDYELQSNPLHMCVRPEAIIELTKS